MVETRLARICDLLNREKAKYLIVGGEACILHGLTRTTEDIDVFISNDADNVRRVLTALSRLPYGIAKELSSDDIARKPITIIGDQPRVDILTRLGGDIPFDIAWRGRLNAKIEGVMVPYINLDLLIKSKDTDRLQDRADKEKLERLKPHSQTPNP